MIRGTHYLIAFVFFIFAFVQWNDPDYYYWIPAYLVVSVIAFLATRNVFYTKLYLALGAGFLIWMAFYIPHIIDWVRQGFPSITTEMKAETLYIELTREFLGLTLCLMAIIFYYVLSHKNNKK